ncbi:NAD-P-binding protein [Pholiota molesta]|nr:NAD-P-binding protein [Pholiota molesta]
MASTTEILGGLTASSMFNLRGVVAVVTGGGTGIGLMMTSTLVANGAKVYIVGPNQKDLDRIAEVYNAGVTEGMGSIQGVQGDIRQKSEATRIATLIGEREPNGVTALFNKLDDFDDVYRTNAVGPYWLTFAFLPLLEKWKSSPGGTKFVPQVIMTSSMNGWTKDAATGGFSFPYIFSKSAIGHATSSLARELLPLGIRVNGIAPGLFPTDVKRFHAFHMKAFSIYTDWSILDDESWTNGRKGVTTLPADKEVAFEVPANKSGGTRHDMGALVLFLVANWYVNGETVLIDGGTLLKHPSSY